MSMIDLVVVAHTDHVALESTLRSIMAQVPMRVALVVVDVGSAVVSPYLLHLIEAGACRHLALPGLNRYEAINRGIGAGSGQYIMVLHEGDKLADSHVLADCERRLLACRAAPDVLYGARIKYFGSYWYYKQPRRPDQVALGMFVELSCMLIRRELFHRLTFDPSYTEAGDYAFVCQLMRLYPDVRWVRFDRILVQVVLDKMHEGHLGSKLKEDWQVQRDWVQSGVLMRTFVLFTRLISQCLRRLCRVTLGYPGFQTGTVPESRDGRVFVK